MRPRFGKFGRLSRTAMAVGLFGALFSIGVGTGTAAAAGSADSEIGTSGVFTIGPGHTFIDWVPGASSTLVRTADGISFTLRTSGLPAGHAFTLWALIFNNPSGCNGSCNESAGDLNLPAVNGSVEHITGHIVGGAATTLSGHISVGDSLVGNDIAQFRGPGLLPLRRRDPPDRSRPRRDAAGIAGRPVQPSITIAA